MRGYFAACAALIGYALGYALPVYTRLPRLHYDPNARRFLFQHDPGPIPMGYLGQVLWGLAGAALAGGVAWAIAARRTGPASDGAVALAGAWALTALALVGAYFTWNNWP